MANVNEWVRAVLEHAFGPSERCGGADWSVEAAYYVCQTVNGWHSLYVILDEDEVSLTLRPITEENFDDDREWATSVPLRPLEVITYLQGGPWERKEAQKKWVRRCASDIADRGGKHV